MFITFVVTHGAGMRRIGETQAVGSPMHAARPASACRRTPALRKHAPDTISTSPDPERGAVNSAGLYH